MSPLHPISKLSYTLFPHTTLFRARPLIHNHHASSYLFRRNWPDKYPAHFRMLFAHSVFDVLDPRLNVPSAKIVIEIDTQHREHLIRRHMSSPHLDRKSTRLTPVTNANLVCRLLLEKKKKYIN